eukprot:snap_masked-scaffold_29-processed-gene-0.27-mRNA-1 protein AED:1.00 eAED:1.00 QI:0/0/0/0/1/1/2/0/63
MGYRRRLYPSLVYVFWLGLSNHTTGGILGILYGVKANSLNMDTLKKSFCLNNTKFLWEGDIFF